MRQEGPFLTRVLPTPSAGEHMDQFESFETKRFVQRLLGKGDVSGLMDKIQGRRWREGGEGGKATQQEAHIDKESALACASKPCCRVCGYLEGCSKYRHTRQGSSNTPPNYGRYSLPPPL